ncbi:MAG: toxin glutamine deamidase domain-containing protein [Spirochaetia bacterium]|nr:toxin glutamine deamidase domain-containing protein [Spirochaetia bacterium]
MSNVEYGKEMSFKEADSGHVNPKFDSDFLYQINCQTCVVVFEASLRGWNIEACPFLFDGNADLLANQTNLAWINEDGKHPDYVIDLNANDVESVYAFIDKSVKSGQRYTLEGIWEGGFGGHIISVFRDTSDKLVFYDPQTNTIYDSKSIKEDILGHFVNGNSPEYATKLLRIDNADIDIAFANPIVKESEYYA